MDSGAALRARDISLFRSAMRYCSSGAMAEYEASAACARASDAVPSKAINARIRNAAVAIFAFSRFLARMVFTTFAVTPAAEVALVTTSVAVVMQTGHIMLLLSRS